MPSARNVLTTKQANFVKNLAKGDKPQTAFIKAGYSPKYANVTAYKTMQNPKIQRALDKAGLTDESVGKILSKAISSGLGVKATNADAIKGVQLVTQLRGYHSRTPENMTQNNTYINEIKAAPDDKLVEMLETLQREIQDLK